MTLPPDITPGPSGLLKPMQPRPMPDDLWPFGERWDIPAMIGAGAAIVWFAYWLWSVSA